MLRPSPHNMRILFITHRFPYPPNRGDRIRSWQFVRALASFADVDLACTADEPVSGDQLATVERICRRVACVPIGRSRWLSAAGHVLMGRSATEGLFASAELRRTLRRWNGEIEYDAALAYCSSMSGYLDLLTHVPQSRKFIDFVDVDSRKWSDYAAAARGPSRLLYQLESRRVARLERQAPDRCHRVFVTNRREAKVARHVVPRRRVAVIRNSVESIIESTPPTNTSPACLFVGALDYLPNVNAVRWFSAEVWPQIRRTFPTARFLVVGRRPVRSVQELSECGGIEIHADVPDVRRFLAEATVVVAPLAIARGVQNKLLEAMAAGRVVVTSKQAADGVEAKPGTHLIEADGAAEWIAAVQRLFDDPALRTRVATAARQFVRANHSPDDQRAGLRNWLSPRRSSALKRDDVAKAGAR